MQDMGKEIQQVTNDLNKYNVLIQAKSNKYNADLSKASSYLQEAGTRVQTAGTYMNKSQSVFGSSRDYYQRAMQELSAISGAITAPPQQQRTQRQEQGATS